MAGTGIWVSKKKNSSFTKGKEKGGVTLDLKKRRVLVQERLGGESQILSRISEPPFECEGH